MMSEPLYTQGRAAALAAFGVKTAAGIMQGPARMPARAPARAPRPVAKAQPAAPAPAAPAPAAPAPAAPATAPAAAPPPRAAPTPQAGYKLTPAEEAQAQRMRGMSQTDRAKELGLDRNSVNDRWMRENDVSAASAAPQTQALTQAQANKPGFAARAWRPVRNTLALTGLGAAGAMAYGIHRQNERDRASNSLVHAPMQGSFLQ